MHVIIVNSECIRSRSAVACMYAELEAKDVANMFA